MQKKSEDRRRWRRSEISLVLKVERDLDMKQK